MPDLLHTTIEHTRGDLQRADNTAVGHIVAIAGLAALVGQIGKDLPHHVLLAVSTAALPAAATLVFAAAVLRPRGRRQRGAVVPGSWVHATRQQSWSTLLDAYDQADPREVAARQLRAFAAIAEAKFAWLARSTVLLITTVAVLAAAFTYGALSALL